MVKWKMVLAGVGITAVVGGSAAVTMGGVSASGPKTHYVGMRPAVVQVYGPGRTPATHYVG